MFKSLEVKYPKFYQVFRFIIVIIASVLYAWNLRCFAKVADLLPGGFSGVSLLFQAIGLRFFISASHLQYSMWHLTFPSLHCLPLHRQEVYHLLNRGNYTFQCAC